MKSVFRLKSAAPVRTGENDRPNWNYDRNELIADGIVHAIGVIAGLIGASVLITLAVLHAKSGQVISVAVYVMGLLAMLSLSAVYNIWPVSPRKWQLRRFDHAAIFLLIAGTYTPVFYAMRDFELSMVILSGVWAVALAGAAMKIMLPGRFERLSIFAYLLLGWSGIIAYRGGVSSLSGWTLGMIVAGGLLYSLGVIFHTWERLRFQNAIWHLFVLLGATCHYTAVLDLVLT